MRVVVCPADEGGCGYYRIRWVAEALKAQGEDVLIAVEGGDVDVRPVYETTPMLDRVTGRWWNQTEIIDVTLLDDVDVLVLQRPLNRDFASWIPIAREKGVAVVVEVDDDFESVSRANVAWAKLHSEPDRRHPRWLREAVRQADLVTVTTPALARRYGAHGRVAVLPNYVPAAALTLPKTTDPERVAVGWTGALATHPNDLQQVGNALGRLLEKRPEVDVHVIGGRAGVARRLGVPDERLSSRGWVPLAEYHRAMAAWIDVGIVPLEPSAFNEAKSSLKMREFAATGSLVVASPTAANVADSDVGLRAIARKPREWERQLHWAVDAVLSDREGCRAEARAWASALTIEANAWRWVEAWAQAMINRRKRAA